MSVKPYCWSFDNPLVTCYARLGDMNYMNMKAEQNSVWSSFIENTIANNKPVAVFLSTGVKLQGIIVAYDEHDIQIQCTRDRTTIVVRCSYITTISDRDGASNNDRQAF